MNLLDELQEQCVLMEKRRIADGEGGWEVVYTEGAGFMADISLNTTTQAEIAERQGMTKIYDVITSANSILSFHDVFKRKSDGKIFRATSDGNDNVTPKTAMLQLSKVTAEEYTLPGGTT